MFGMTLHVFVIKSREFSVLCGCEEFEESILIKVSSVSNIDKISDTVKNNINFYTLFNIVLTLNIRHGFENVYNPLN
jgi:hypothetical protein